MTQRKIKLTGEDFLDRIDSNLFWHAITRGISFWHSFLVREIFNFSKILFWHIFWMIQISFWHIFRVNDWVKKEWLIQCVSHTIFNQSLTWKMCQNKICIIQKMCQYKIFEKMKISLTRKLCQKEIARVDSTLFI